MKNCFKVHSADNVATMLENASNEPVAVVGTKDHIMLKRPVALGHKVALTAIEPGGRVTKYGVTIGIATQKISPGEWVHLHNCRSQVDKRSATLDVETGATTDIAYE